MPLDSVKARTAIKVFVITLVIVTVAVFVVFLYQMYPLLVKGYEYGWVDFYAVSLIIMVFIVIIVLGVIALLLEGR